MHALREFTAGQASEIAHISYRCLDHWAAEGVVQPSVAHAAGTGSERRYGFGDLVALRAVALFRQSGVALETLRPLAHRLAQLEHDHPRGEGEQSELVILLTPDGAVHECNTDELSALLSRIAAPVVHVARVQQIIDDVTAAHVELQFSRAVRRRGRPKGRTDQPGKRRRRAEGERRGFKKPN